MQTSASSWFCAGGAMIMGGNGFTLAGTGDDCLMLWTEVFTVNSLERAVMANVGVFLLALLAQFLTTTNANRMQRAKQYGKVKRLQLAVLARTSNDPETGRGSTDSSSGGYAATTTTEWPSEAKIQSVNGADQRATSPIVLDRVSLWEHFGDSMQHGCRILVAYLLMLAAMTYDIGLISSTVLGFMLGFFFFTKDTTKVPESADPCCS